MESKVSVNIDNRIFLTEKSVTQIVISEGMAKICTSKVLGNGVCEEGNYVVPLCKVKISINEDA